MLQEIQGARWRRRRCEVFVAISFIGVLGITVRAVSGEKNDITGTVSKAEPPTLQDGTAAHPYADVSHCPSKVDIIFWSRNDQPIPIIPPSISVCFVGDRPLNSGGGPQVSGGGPQVRDR